MSKMKAFLVFLNGEEVDTVFFCDGFTSSEVKNSLVNRDGYNPNIKVFREEFFNELDDLSKFHLTSNT